MHSSFSCWSHTFKTILFHVQKTFCFVLCTSILWDYQRGRFRAHSIFHCTWPNLYLKWYIYFNDTKFYVGSMKNVPLIKLTTKYMDNTRMYSKEDSQWLIISISSVSKVSCLKGRCSLSGSINCIRLDDRKIL